MAVVKPFNGWRYNSEKFEDLSGLVVPPYDVISPEDLVKLKERDAHNFSNIILADGDKKHEKAASLFKSWQKDGTFVQDKKPTLYFYKQIFKLKPLELFCQNVPPEVREGEYLERTGILCRVGLEDYSSKIILPHEKTFSGPKADRYQLMTAAQGNMEPVFLGYDSDRFSGDEFQKICLGKRPEYEFTDDSGVKHQLWLITDAGVLDEVGRALSSKKFFILDGHHRYETALKFYHDHQKSDAHVDHRFVLANICSFQQPGTIILPTHRAIKGLKNFDAKSWIASQNVTNKVTWGLTLSQLEDLMRKTELPSFGFISAGYKTYTFIEITNPTEGLLDLEILHSELIPSMDATHNPEEIDISYIKDIGELESKTVAKEFQAGFLVKPSTAYEVMAVAENSKVMPHKSTFFYPKIPSGLVVNTFG